MKLFLTFLAINLLGIVSPKKPTQTFVITHSNIFDWDMKQNKFKAYTGWWPPENTQIKSVEETYLEVTPTSIKIISYYHHAYCSEVTQTFTFSVEDTKGKLNIKNAKFRERGVFQDCDGAPELLYGTAQIEGKTVSLNDLLSGKIREGTMLTFWYFVPSQKVGTKMAIKIKNRKNA